MSEYKGVDYYPTNYSIEFFNTHVILFLFTSFQGYSDNFIQHPQKLEIFRTKNSFIPIPCQKIKLIFFLAVWYKLQNGLSIVFKFFFLHFLVAKVCGQRIWLKAESSIIYFFLVFSWNEIIN